MDWEHSYHTIIINVMQDVSYTIKHGALLFGVCSHMLLDTLTEIKRKTALQTPRS